MIPLRRIPSRETRALERTRPEAPLEARRIGGIGVAVVDRSAIVDRLAARLDGLHFTPVAFANAHCVNLAAKDADYRRSLADFTVLADGIGVDLASRALYGEPFPANLNGTDFLPEFLGALPGRRRIALVGGGPGVAMDAAAALGFRFPNHEFRAVSHGYFRPGLETEIVLARLRKFSPDVTLVALGVPRQEHFIAKHLTLNETTIAFGVGALFDFLSGRVSRAPAAWRRLRIEWVFRLLNEPSRLWRRYVLGNPRFLLHVFGELLMRGRVPGRSAP